MAKVTYVDSGGRSVTLDVPTGSSVMQAAVEHGLDGIEGQCGGSLACASCHVRVDPAWLERTGEPDDMEFEMLDGTMSPRTDTSRLSCQILVDDHLDGLIVETPDAQ